MNSTELSFGDESFDVVTSFQVIEHIEDTDKFLRQMTRVLRKQGTALISTPNKQTYSPYSIGPENPFHVREFYKNEFEELLKKYFNEVEIRGVNPSIRLAELGKSVNGSLFSRFNKLLRQFHLSFLFKLIPKQIKVLRSGTAGNINSSDFTVARCEPDRSLDFIAICKKT
jgi:ubiquinone/menaquinone biosynthesis C-methylase UbiE